MRIEIWSDVVCPWCYLGDHRLAQVLADAGPDVVGDVEVVHRSYQLDSTATVAEPTDDMLARKYGLSPEQVDGMQRQMEQRAAADGLTYHLDGQLTGNTFDAHRLLHLAAERGVQAEQAERLFRAHFTEQRSVFDAASLADLAVEAGLERAEAERVLAGDDYADAVRADLEQAREYGIQGVPFFVFDGRFAVSGAQPAEVLAAALARAGQPA
jgi:predicted DsbA family dithiol-disulfide isomerase